LHLKHKLNIFPRRTLNSNDISVRRSDKNVISSTATERTTTSNEFIFPSVGLAY